MKSKNKKTIMIVLLVVLLLAISIGYAALQSNLTITGTAGINNAKWDIHWENVQITSGSVSTSAANKATIDSSKTTVNYNIALAKPGDFYEFTVDAVNDGTIDGMVSTVTSKLNGTTITTLPEYLQYEVKYADGLAVHENHLLESGATETYRVRVAFKRDIDASQLPSSAQTLNLSFSVVYQQANDNAESARDYLYRSNDNVVNIGDSSSTLGTTYTSYEGLNSVENTTVFLRHKVKNGIIQTSEVGFIYNGNAYYIVGGVNESGNEDRPIYTANVATINSTGETTCTATSTRCIFNKSGTTAYAAPTGQVYANANGLRCDITVDGSSYCH